MSAREDCRENRTLWLGMALGAVLGVIVALTATYLVGRDAPALEPGPLRILSSRDDSVGGQRQVLIDQWNATHPENQAEIIELPPQTDAARSQMVADAQSGQAGVDIYNIDVVSTAQFADAGYIRPLDESTVDRKEFLSGPIETCVYQGKLWALPFNTDAGLLYYRNDLVPEPPVSWSQLVGIAENFLAHHEAPAAGYAGQLDRYEGLTVNALEAIQASAVSDVVRNGKVTVSLKDIEDGIRRLMPPLQEQKDEGVVLRESLEHDEEGSIQAFREGKVLFMRNWPRAHRSLDPPPTGERSGGKAVPFTVTTLPGGSVLGGQNLAIAASTTKPRAAQALIEFLTDARSQQILFERGGLAATREVVYRDGTVRDRYPYVDILLRAIQTARPRPVTPCYARFSEAFYTGVHQALRTRRPLPDDFIDTLNTALNC